MIPIEHTIQKLPWVCVPQNLKQNKTLFTIENRHVKFGKSFNYLGIPIRLLDGLTKVINVS